MWIEGIGTKKALYLGGLFLLIHYFNYHAK